jgi:hypothetical protein
LAKGGLWRDRPHLLPSPHQPRDCLGELVQIDGSEHAPFEDCDPPCTLLGFVDDWFPADDPRRTRGHLSGTAEVASVAAPMLPQDIANRGKPAKASPSGLRCARSVRLRRSSLAPALGNLCKSSRVQQS